MKKTCLGLAFAGTLFLTPAALAAPDTDTSTVEDMSYFGVQYTNASYKEVDFREADPSLALVRFGKIADKSLALEGRLGIGIDGGEIYAGTGYTGYDTYLILDVDSLMGLYAMPGVTFADKFRLYAAVGFTSAQLTATATDATGSGSYSATETGLSWGFGGEAFLSPTASITIEHMTYLDQEAFTLSGLGFGLNLFY